MKRLAPILASISLAACAAPASTPDSAGPDGSATREASVAEDSGSSSDARAHDVAEDSAPAFDSGRTGAGIECMTARDCQGGIVPGAVPENEGIACISGRCGCRSDADCPSGTSGPICDTAALRCVGCMTTAQCGERQTCRSNRCIECANNSECESSLVGRVCTFERCGCERSTDCPAGRACESGLCVPRCTSDAQCTDPNRRRCEPTSGLCVFCLTDGECVAFGTTSGWSCVAATHTCGCTTNDHCAVSEEGRSCRTARGACGCMFDEDCPARTPRCRMERCV